MTSASELFCSRRSRFGRNNVNLEMESAPDLSYRRRQFERRSGGYSVESSRRHGLDGCVLVGMSSDYDPVYTALPIEFNQSYRDYIARMSGEAPEEGSGSTDIGRHPCNARGRLPGAVLQARERLFRRLRGSSTVSDRGSTSNVSPNGNVFNDEYGHVDSSDWETADNFRGISPADPTLAYPTTTTAFFQRQYKLPPALSPEVLNSLSTEIFNASNSVCNNESSDNNNNNLDSYDCSICLEKFIDGDELVRLPCGHRFHLTCLSEWGQVRGSCPCCRSFIV